MFFEGDKSDYTNKNMRNICTCHSSIKVIDTYGVPTKPLSPSLTFRTETDVRKEGTMSEYKR